MWSLSLTDDSKSITGDLEQDFTHHLQESLARLAQTLDIQSASLYLCDRKTGQLQRAAEYGEGINFIDIIRFDNGSGLSAWIAQKRRIIYLPDIHRGSRHGYAPIRSYLAQPIYLNGEVISVLNLAHIVPYAFDDKQELIQTFIDDFIHLFQRYVLRRYEPERHTDFTQDAINAFPVSYEP